MKTHATPWLLVLCLSVLSCAAPDVNYSDPEENLVKVRKDISKRRFEAAEEGLEELRLVTAGTRLGGEVQFLLGEVHFRQSHYEEADSHFAAYLAAYPGGPFSEKALYMQAQSKIELLEKVAIGFLTFRSYIPHDRDITLLREARELFELYNEMYPDGEWAGPSAERAQLLLRKEGEHELGIASFYLKKDRPGAALARARRILEGDYPESIMSEAELIADDAASALSRENEK